MGKLLKMKDLERMTGVGREAIRFYIRQGLLPEPLRPGRNVAWYDESFVERVLLIKRLQHERFLPLSVIKGILGDVAEPSAAEAAALQALEGRLSPASVATAPENLGVLCERLHLPAAEVRELAAAGTIEITVRDGAEWLEGPSVAIVEEWAALRRAGFTRERGFDPELARLYVEMVEWLARQELRVFSTRIAGKVDPEAAPRMAREGIDRINRVLGLLREKALLRLIAAGGNPDAMSDPRARSACSG